MSNKDEAMQVDLSKAKAGDTVKFRCGGEAVIYKAEFVRHDERSVTTLRFSVDGFQYHYYCDGALYGNTDHLLDITEVIPAPEVFDWGTVKWGMAFEHNGSFDLPKILTYIGRGIHGSPVFQRGINPEYVSMDLRNAQDKLTRSPEHDVEVG